VGKALEHFQLLAQSDSDRDGTLPEDALLHADRGGVLPLRGAGHSRGALRQAHGYYYLHHSLSHDDP
jgi:hypothetical protein